MAKCGSLMLKTHSVPTNRASFIRDGPFVQGLQPWIDTVARQNALMISNTFNFPANIYHGGIDPDLFVASHYTEDEDGVRTYATPWDHAPGNSEADAAFRREVAECEAKMEHLATHTPKYFLSSKRKRSHDDDGEGAEVGRRTNTGVLPPIHL